jgi:hypothetical protein
VCVWKAALALVQGLWNVPVFDVELFACNVESLGEDGNSLVARGRADVGGEGLVAHRGLVVMECEIGFPVPAD